MPVPSERSSAPALLLSCVLASACLAFTDSASAQVCVQCEPGEADPPQVTISPQSGSFGTADSLVHVTIAWFSGGTLNPQQRQIVLNGQDITTQFGYSGSGTYATSEAVVRLAPNINTLTAAICDLEDQCSMEVVTYNYTYMPPSSVEVTPKGRSTTRVPNEPYSEVFVVHNTGPANGTFQLQGSCDGSQVYGCDVSRTTIALPPGDSASVAVAYWTDGGGGGGLLMAPSEVTLRAWNAADAAVRDSATISIIVGDGFLAGATTGVNDVGDNTRLNRGECVMAAAGAGVYECGDLRLVHSLPATRILNRTRAPTLVYSSQHARPHPVVGVPFQPTLSNAMPWNLPHVQEVRAVLVMGSTVLADRTWSGLNISTSGHSHVPMPTYRFALGFDTNLPTGAYDYEVQVTATYSDGVVEQHGPHAGRLVVVNRRSSNFGSGWWVAGVESLHFVQPDTASRLWVGGDGSHRLYHRVSPTTWAANAWDRPDTLAYDPATAEYIRRLPGQVEVRFDWAGKHVRTVNAAGHWTEFEWDGSHLVRIHLPRAPGFNTGYSYYFAYANAGGKLSGVASPGLPRPVSIGMDGGRITSISGPDQHGVTFTYSGSSTVPASRVDRRQIETTFEFDAGRRLSRVTNTMGTASSSDDLVVGFRAAESQGIAGPVPMADVYTLIDGPRADSAGLDHTRFWLNRWGAVVSVQDATGNKSSVFRNDPVWPGVVTQTVAPNGLRTSATYDARGNITTETRWNPYSDGRNTTTIYRWDPVWDAVTEATMPEGETMRTSYNAVGWREWDQVGSDPSRRVDYFYNARGQMDSVRMPSPGGQEPTRPVEQYDYDVNGNLTSVTSPIGAVFRYHADAAGRDTLRLSPITVGLVQRERRERIWYDVSGRVDSVTTMARRHDPTGFVADTLERVTVANTHDAEGNITAIGRRISPNPAGLGLLETSWMYDAAGRVLRVEHSKSNGGDIRLWGGRTDVAISSARVRRGNL